MTRNNEKILKNTLRQVTIENQNLKLVIRQILRSQEYTDEFINGVIQDCHRHSIIKTYHKEETK